MTGAGRSHGVDTSMIICVFCIAEMVKADNKSCFMLLKST